MLALWNHDTIIIRTTTNVYLVGLDFYSQKAGKVSSIYDQTFKSDIYLCNKLHAFITCVY